MSAMGVNTKPCLQSHACVHTEDVRRCVDQASLELIRSKDGKPSRSSSTVQMATTPAPTNYNQDVDTLDLRYIPGSAHDGGQASARIQRPGFTAYRRIKVASACPRRVLWCVMHYSICVPTVPRLWSRYCSSAKIFWHQRVWREELQSLSQLRRKLWASL